MIEPPEERVTAEQSAAARMTLAAIIISAFGLLGKILGYGKEILIAAYWGRGAAVDAFVVVYKTIVFELYVKIEKLLRPTYLPIFVARKSEGDDDRAWRYFSVISTFVFVFMTPLVLAAIIWAPGLIRTLFPGLEMVDLAADMLRISGAATLLMVLSVMTELTLHSHKEFTIPALADATRQFVLFGTIGALIGFGIYPTGEPEGLKAAAVGVLLGGAARLLVQIPAILRRMTTFRPGLDVSNPDVRRMFSLMPPVIVGLLFSLARNYFDRRFGTDAGEGVVSALNYGRMLADLPTLILPLAVSLVVYPFVSEWASQQDRKRLADSLVSMTRVMAFIFVPLAVAMMVLAQPIIATAFERGEFTSEDTVAVTRALVPYAAGLPFFAVEASINKWYFALGDTATPNYAGAVAAVLHILIAGAGVYAFNRSIGIIAAALSISKGLKVIALYLMLRKRIGAVNRAAIVSFLVRLLIATGIMTAAVAVVANGVGSMVVDAGTIQRLIFLAIVGCSGIVVYLAAAAVLRIEELTMVTGYVRGKLMKRFGGR